MAHLTEVIESATDVYAMEPHANGFWTRPMGYCAMVVMLWDLHGSLYQNGRAQHCSGGLGAAQLDDLSKDLPGKADVLVVLVLGKTDEMLSMDKTMLKTLEELVRKNNWEFRQFRADTGNSVVTRDGRYQTKDDYDPGLRTAVEKEEAARCCISCAIM